MDSTVNFVTIFTTLMDQIKALRSDHRLYSDYTTAFKLFIDDMASMVDGHFIECSKSTTGDVVDTCPCHRFVYNYPHELLKSFLYAHNMLVKGPVQLLGDMIDRVKDLAAADAFYLRYEHIITTHIGDLYAHPDRNDCTAPGCLWHYYTHLGTHELVRLFLVDHYLHTLTL